MNAIDFLIRQHRTLEAALRAGLDAEASKRAPTVKRLADDLGKHMSSEEQVFYPAVRAHRTEDILLESLEEHLSLKRLLADLLELDSGAETWEAKLKVLDEQTRHHHREEVRSRTRKARRADRKNSGGTRSHRAGWCGGRSDRRGRPINLTAAA